MTASRTTAVLEDARHLRLNEPLAEAGGSVLNVIVLTSPESAEPASPGQTFQAALGSYCRDHPAEVRRTSDEWMAELREGEHD